ncbi:hypothetical protein [Chitinimonas naiadis]
MSLALLVKLFAAPLMIALASLAGKRWGPNVAGLLGGLPLVGAPVVLTLWLSHGSLYAADVSLAAPVGVWANIGYMLVVGYASVRFRWPLAILSGWLAYVLGAVLLHFAGLAHSVFVGLAALFGLWLAAVRWLPKPQAAPLPVHLPRVEILTRMAAAAGLVLSLTALSGLFGPSLTGLFTGAPIAASVIPAFTYANAGRDALLLVLRGFLTGLMGFVVFFYALGYGIPALGWWAFVPAMLVGLGVGFTAARYARRAG